MGIVIGTCIPDFEAEPPTHQRRRIYGERFFFMIHCKIYRNYQK